MDASHRRSAVALMAALAAFAGFLLREVLPQAGRPDPRTLTPRVLRR